MSDELTESGQEQGTAGVPTPEFSSPSDDKPTSDNVLGQFLSRLEKIESEIEKSQRQSQSTKDKRISRLEKDLGDLREVLSTYGVKGEAVDRAFERMEYDQLRQRVSDLVSGQDAGSVPPQRQATKTGTVKVSEGILAKAGISNDDPEVAEMAKREYDAPEDWFLALGELAAKRKLAGEPASTPSVRVNDSGGKAPVVTDRSGKLDKLYAEMSTLNRDPVTNYQKLAKVKDEIRKLGGDI